MGRLEVMVVEARRIANIQKIGEVDPYVKVKYGLDDKTRLRFKTKVIDNSVNPVWKEVFMFQIADTDTAQIRFEVWNDNVIKDDLLGYYNLSLNALEKGVVKDVWCVLKECTVSTAELHLKLLAVDFGPSPAAGTPTVSTIADQATIDKTKAEAEQDPKFLNVPKVEFHQGSVPISAGQPAAVTPTNIDIHIQAPQGYPPQQAYLTQGYPPQQAYPPQGYPPQQAYPPQGYPPQQAYAPQGYPPQPAYPPQGYPPQPGYPPHGAYPPQPGYPPQGAYPPQGGYPPQPQGYPPRPGYPPQQGYPQYPPYR